MRDNFNGVFEILDCLTNLQVSNIYRKIYNSLTKDSFGVDWNTLYITNPESFYALKNLQKELKKRGLIS